MGSSLSGGRNLPLPVGSARTQTSVPSRGPPINAASNCSNIRADGATFNFCEANSNRDRKLQAYEAQVCWLAPPGSRPGREDVFCSAAETPWPRVKVGSEPLQRILVRSEEGLDVPAFLARPPGTPTGLVVEVDDRRKEAMAGSALFARALRERWAVCAVDLRGIGEMATSKMGWVSAVSLLAGEHFVKCQGRDLRLMAKHLGDTSEFTTKPVALYARGHNAVLALVAACVLRNGFRSYRQFVERPKSLERSCRLQPDAEQRFAVYDRGIPPFDFPFRALRVFDLPQLLEVSTMTRSHSGRRRA